MSPGPVVRESRRASRVLPCLRVWWLSVGCADRELESARRAAAVTRTPRTGPLCPLRAVDARAAAAVIGV